MKPVATFDYSKIFNLYYTTEEIPFTLKNRSIAFPEDKDNAIYGIKYIAEDIPWTILSYSIYGNINYWWLLSSLNPTQIFYAEAGTEIRYILPEYLDEVVGTIEEQSNA